MRTIRNEHRITDPGQLDELYGPASEGSILKEVDHVHRHYRAMIEAAPFVAVATSGPGGLDVSPRGDPAGFVEVADEKTILIPDRRGNNRLDSLRNILADPRIALLFLIPGVGETLRVNGRAEIVTDPELLGRFVMQGRPPRLVILVRVETVYFQCSKAIVRSGLWDPARQIARSALPSTGTMLADLSRARVGGADYDRELPERLKATLY